MQVLGWGGAKKYRTKEEEKAQLSERERKIVMLLGGDEHRAQRIRQQNKGHRRLIK